jgi:hypothetical protein
MELKDVDEALAVLYLRLNGYFTTGLIIHSPVQGQAMTEVDCVAIRMPNRQQPDRIIWDAPFLRIEPGLIDLINCEVKSSVTNLTFNKPLKTNRLAIEAVLNWAGIHAAAKITSVAETAMPLFTDDVMMDQAVAGITDGTVRVHGLLCCPISPPSNGERWLLDGAEILRYAEECFNPVETRNTCSVRYNFQQWSYPLNKIVIWLKDKNRVTPATVNALYDHLGIVRMV